MNDAQDGDLCQRLYPGPESESSNLAGGPTECTGVLPSPGMRKKPLLARHKEIVYPFQQLSHSEFSFGADLKFLQNIAK